MEQYYMNNSVDKMMKRVGNKHGNFNQGHVRGSMNGRSRVIKSISRTTRLKDHLSKYAKLFFVIVCLSTLLGIYYFVDYVGLLWDESEIRNEADELSHKKLIYRGQFYQPKETAENATHIKSYSEFETDELSKNYTEYKGPLHCGNLIKARLCKELIYLRYLLDHSEPGALLRTGYDTMYNLHRPDVEIIKKDTNYEEIKKNVTELVDQIPEGDESGQTVRQQEFIQNIKALQDPLKSKCDKDTITKEGNEAIDDLLDYIHHNLYKFKEDAQKNKIWTLQGLFSLCKKISIWPIGANFVPGLQKILEGIVSNEMMKMTNTRIQNRVDRIVQWVSLFPTDGWMCFERMEVSSDLKSTVLVYGEGCPVLNPEIGRLGIQMYPQIQKNLSEDEIRELARPTRKTKREHKEWFVESLSLLLTEGTHLFQTRQIKFHTRLNTILQALIREGFQIKPSLEK